MALLTPASCLRISGVLKLVLEFVSLLELEAVLSELEAELGGCAGVEMVLARRLEGGSHAKGVLSLFTPKSLSLP